MNVSCTETTQLYSQHLVSKPSDLGRAFGVNSEVTSLPAVPSPYIAAEAFLPVDGFDMPLK